MRPNIESYRFETEDEAWRIIVELQDILNSNGVCTVSDFKHIMGSGANAEDVKFGWKDLDDVDVDRSQFGYYMILPDIEEV